MEPQHQHKQRRAVHRCQILPRDPEFLAASLSVLLYPSLVLLLSHCPRLMHWTGPVITLDNTSPPPVQYGACDCPGFVFVFQSVYFSDREIQKCFFSLTIFQKIYFFL